MVLLSLPFNIIDVGFFFFLLCFLSKGKLFRMKLESKQDKIGQSLEHQTKNYVFSSSQGLNPSAHALFLLLMFFTFIELCTRAKINL